MGVMVHVVLNRRRGSRSGSRNSSRAVSPRSDWAAEADRVVREFQAGATADPGELRKSLCWLFEHVAGAAGSGTAIGRERFHQACEAVLFEQGEAAFDRMLTPVLRALLAAGPGAASGTLPRHDLLRWLRALGVEQAAAVRACDRARPGDPAHFTLQDVLRAVRAHHMHPPAPRR